MVRRWAVPALVVAVALAQVAPAGEPFAEPAEDRLLSLQLSERQRAVLDQVFRRHAFETPAAPAPDAPLGVRVEPTVPGGVYRLGPAGDLPARLRVTVRSTQAAGPVQLAYYAEDFYGRKVGGGPLPPLPTDAAGLATADLVLREAAAFGYYHVLVTATAEDRTATAACGLAVIAPPEPTGAPSPLGLTAPPGRLDPDFVEAARRLGVRRVAFDWADASASPDAPAGAAAKPDSPSAQAGAARPVNDADALALLVEAGLDPVGIVRLGPPPDPAEAEATAARAADALQHDAAPEDGAPERDAARPEAARLRDWQLGRPAALDRDSLARSASAFRETVARSLTAIRAADVPATLWAAATPDVLVDVLTEGPALAGADGVTLHVDAGAADANLRSGEYRRTLDYALQVARRAGVKRIAVAEAGEDPSAASPQQQAWKLVTRHVLALAAGAEAVYAAPGRGVPAPLPSAVAYAWMARLLDATAYKADLWPQVPLLEAHLFDGPARRVAVVWSWAGDDPANPDRGALVLENGDGLEALDVVGQPVGIWKGPRLIVPLGEAPVYLVSTSLRADAVRDRLRSARAHGVAPATVRLLSLLRSAPPGRTLVHLWVQSHRPQRMDGMAGLLLPAGWRARQSRQQFGLDPGEAREFTFECDTTDEAGPPPYTLTAAATLGNELARHAQAVWPAQAVRRSIEVGYGLADWEGIDPVVLEDPDRDLRAEVRTAWDAQHFYFAATVRRSRATFRAGPLPTDGDAIQLAFGAAARADDDFGHAARGQALPAGAFRDTDHLVALIFSADGPQVLRLRMPRMALRSAMPGNLDARRGPVEGSAADIARDPAAPVTLFEAAIPWKALAPLRPETGRMFRFGFRIGDGDGPPLEWARVAGVPDYLAGPGSFLPTAYTRGLPCQTWWTLAGPRPGGEAAAKP